MSTHLEQTIAGLQNEIRTKEEELHAIKKTVNMLSERAGGDPIYPDTNPRDSEPSLGLIQSDTFYGQALNSSIRKILTMRKAAGKGPAKVREIFDALQKGGYLFETKNDANAMRGLRISIGKSSRDFHKLPNGEYGLTEWYPAVKAAKNAPKPEVDQPETENNPEGGEP